MIPPLPNLLLRRLAVASLLPVLTACGGDGGTTQAPVRPPVITVIGVEDGAVFDEPVTITVSVDAGTFTATLNGQSFFSGTVVSAPDAYVLRVEARNAGLTSELELSFEIRFGGDGVLIVRLFNLGDNDAGGGGDAILLTDSTAFGQRHMMIDAGPAGVGGSDRAFVRARLAALGVDTLEVLILSHAHSDHFDGMADILRQIYVRTFYYNGQVRTFNRYQEVLDLAASRAGQRVAVQAPTDFELGFGGTTTLRILAPLATYLAKQNADGSEINEGSLGVALTRGTFRMFFTGDGEVAANQRWRTQFANLTTSLTALKVGHHGANDAVFDNGASGTSTWLGHTAPKLQVITANGSTHPRIRALAALLGQAGVKTFCTNVHGDIEIRVDLEGAYIVVPELNAGMDCVPGDEATT
jgi:competence protein ComEC